MTVHTDDPATCPLCGGRNDCAIACKAGNQPGTDSTFDCWCLSKKVPQSLLDQLPEQERGQRCICQRCIEKAE